jgi:hypothetical protein
MVDGAAQEWAAQQDERSTYPLRREVDAVVVALAAQLGETGVGEDAWDRPATLWELDGPGGGAHLVRVLEGAVHDALVGVTSPAWGVACVSEGWEYPDEAVWGIEHGLPAGAAREWPGAREVRLVFVVTRDAEALVVLGRDGTERHVQRAGGRVCHATRRVLGVPSGADPPPIEALRARACEFAAVVAAKRLGVRAVLDQPAEALRVAAWPVGLDQESWEKAREAALERYEEYLQTARGAERERAREAVAFLAWADGEMWGCRLDEGIPSPAEIDELARGVSEVLWHVRRHR